MPSLDFWIGLERHGDAVAIDLDGGAPISYTRLAALADAFATRLPAERQLVAVEARNEVEAIVAYLACLRHRHPVIILNKEALIDGRILAEYEPNWLYEKRDASWHLKRLGNRTDTAFTDELAVLLSTSGTTGAPKLVKLSYDNIASNAGAIAEYLHLVPDDCAITTLEFCYSYGMSVLNSYLSAGARILLTDEPIVSKRFWNLFASKGATSLALVPSHFDLLDRIDFPDMRLPTLRYVTQAGGKLHADKIRRYAEIARKTGWSFYTMYGQTEASPRMSYVPPDELLANVDSIGKPIPGGEIVLVDESGAEIEETGRAGELVYRGPNVMLGYAESRADLAKPRDTVALRTGDIAQRQENGYFRIVGRLNRFIKLYGLRINLDEVEAFLRREGYPVHCTGNDQTLALFYSESVDEAALRALIHDRYKIQRANIFLMRLDEIPLLSSGKIDYRALSDMIAPAKPKADSKRDVQRIFADALGNEDLDEADSFTSIGGDSLAYLTISLQLEEALGYLPEDWERLSIREIKKLRPAQSAMMSVPADTIVRVLAILSVVTNHLMNTTSDGGAMALIMLIGYSLAKYDSDRLPISRLGDFLSSKLLRILSVYYVIVIAYFVFMWGKRSFADAVPWLLLVPNYHENESALFAYWFIGAYAQLILIFALVWQVPSVRRAFAERKAAFGYIALAIGFVVAFVTERQTSNVSWPHNTFSIWHVCMLGWCAYFAKSIYEKLFISAASVLAVAFFWSASDFVFNVWYFDFFLVASLLAVIWLDRIALPRAVGSFVMWIASISFYLYLLHIGPVLALLRVRSIVSNLGWPIALTAGLALSIALAAVAARLMPHFEGVVRRLWASLVPGRLSRAEPPSSS